MIYRRFCADATSLEDWISQLQTSEALRADVAAAVQQDGLVAEKPPWRPAVV